MWHHTLASLAGSACALIGLGPADWRPQTAQASNLDEGGEDLEHLARTYGPRPDLSVDDLADRFYRLLALNRASQRCIIQLTARLAQLKEFAECGKLTGHYAVMQKDDQAELDDLLLTAKFEARLIAAYGAYLKARPRSSSVQHEEIDASC